MPLNDSYKRNIEDIQSIEVLPTILNVIKETTQMGFIAVARVTQEKWLTCSALDDVNFGLKPGDELVVETTICHEIRQANKLVVIDHVETDPYFRNHPTPLQYGFQSYISVPIILKNGDFFGTLCAIDPKPNKLNNDKVIGMFTLYADLISFHLQAIENLRAIRQKVRQQDVRLEAFEFISSHDLQEPLRKIQTFSTIIREREANNLPPNVATYFKGIEREANKMRKILKDLLDYSETEEFVDRFKTTHLEKIVQRAITRIQQDLTACGGTISLTSMEEVNAIPIQLEQLFYGLLANSIAYRCPNRPLTISIACTSGKGGVFNVEGLNNQTTYCMVTVKDNGIGFQQKYAERIFGMFKRLNADNNDKSTGIGLAIAKRIVENHHGRIFAYGEPDKGATFKIFLPQA
ncbi:His Kinase A (phospho-acceptor) domain-containing protein [Maribacter sedimenticola]|uniref:histidine kinase n=1 Tax=Maribacter sedimenticola TaxID=228956 RepID=A0ABY1SLB4_9FLAO|nr:ATP-binding protein [Maribacter sedimenticola]SNR74520.1 His Kinase A (phospho-acceptor) domain-containing protein [Maribacter sedimenticola]